MQTATFGSIKWSNPIVFAASLGAIAVIVFGALLRWKGLSFSIKPTDILNVLSPLILTSGFVERAVEVLISPWRDGGATKLQNAIDSAKTLVPADPLKVRRVNDELSEYKGTTQRYAFATSLTISLAIGIAGVRTLWPLLDSAKLGLISPAQQNYFLVVDVLLTAALLAGGADGIHTVVEAFTSFFNASAKKTQQAAG